MDKVSGDSVKELRDGIYRKKKIGSIISPKDDWFKEVNHKNNYTNEVNNKIQIKDVKIYFKNEKLLRASEELCKHTQLDNDTNKLPFHCKVCCGI